jgi:hypothetical protein
LGGSAKAQRIEGGAHALPALAHRLVGQADQGELRHAAQYLYLDVDIEDLDPLESYGPDPRNHAHVLVLFAGAIVQGFTEKTSAKIKLSRVSERCRLGGGLVGLGLEQRDLALVRCRAAGDSSIRRRVPDWRQIRILNLSLQI